MTKKRQLEFLLKAYMRNEYDIKTFCDEFTRIFYQAENDDDIISDSESSIFKNLANECERYSPYEDDLLCSNYFVDDGYIDKVIRNSYALYISVSMKRNI